VGILKASITKALNTKAKMNAVISHSNVFAIDSAVETDFFAEFGAPEPDNIF
jgi:hypothetical protein